ncbi:MAG: carbamoyltransferase C-terminal domain-containing protein [Pseudomonadota bacterium]
MKILSLNSGNGGAIAAVDASSGNLLFLYEAEKDNFPKNSSATLDSFIEGSAWFNEVPRVLARTGTAGTRTEYSTNTGAGYFGIDTSSAICGVASLFGERIQTFTSSHERSHIWAAYSMSPFPQGTPCQVLIIDDNFGDFYEIDPSLEIRRKGQFIANPTHRFASVFAAAERGPKFLPIQPGDFGKRVGASSFGQADSVDPGMLTKLTRFMDDGDTGSLELGPLSKMDTSGDDFRNIAAALSDVVLDKLITFIEEKMDKDVPLVIGGEGALNCGWATALAERVSSSEIYITPTANDAGCAIGTAVDAMRHLTGNAKLNWSIYAGRPFTDDRSATVGLGEEEELDVKVVADALAQGYVLGWARGSCEMGRRALGNRSILAAPFEEKTRARINHIKERARDCPVSPICREEDVSDHFICAEPSPYMLYLKEVSDPRLRAITHTDGTARLQTVSQAQNPILHDLLTAFKERTGVGVLCNTSLNFKGAGFINKTSDLHHFAKKNGLDGFVAGIRLYWNLSNSK